MSYCPADIGSPLTTASFAPGRNTAGAGPHLRLGVAAFVDAASFHLGLVTAYSGISLDDAKIGEDCPEIECQSQNRRVVTNLQENPEF